MKALQLVDDSISKRVFLTTADTMVIDDAIAMKVFIRLTDGIQGDSVTIADKIFTKTFWLNRRLCNN